VVCVPVNLSTTSLDALHDIRPGACKRLQPEVAGNKGIAELSKEFVMINCEDDEEPLHQKFKPVRGVQPRPRDSPADTRRVCVCCVLCM
jgi:hypothetical protein